MQTQMNEGSRIGRSAREEPRINNAELLAMVVREFQNVERIEGEIVERRKDITAIVKRLVSKGLDRRAVLMALARRKLLVKGDLEVVDESLCVICGVGALGIQGELFREAEESA